MKALLSFALVAWFFGVLFFVNKAKETYCASDSGIVQRPVVEAGIPVVAFDHYSSTPKTSAAFDFLRDSLKSQLLPTDMLKITGQFTQTESDTDPNIGLRRANALRSLFEGYVDLDKIDIESKLSEKVSTAPTFEILHDQLSQNTQDTPLPPMMDNFQKVKEDETPTMEPVKENVVKESPIKDSDRADYVVYFNDDSSEMIGASDVQQYIDALSKRVKLSKEKIEILGFDDNMRTDAESLVLAKRRTWRVRKAFNDTYVRRRLVQVKNIGQSNPVVSNGTPEGRSKNRRVEIRILKK